MMPHNRLVRSVGLLSTFLLYCSNFLVGVEPNGALCNSDPSSTLAFVGTLTALTSAPTPSPSWNSATFHVTELLQGQNSAEISVLMLKGLCHDSGAAPTLGQTYLVQTHVTPRGSIYQLADCEQIRPVDQATSALEYLRSSQRGTAPTEVFGEATAYGSPSAKRFPLPQTKIHLKGENRQLDFLTDEDGRFHGIVKPGKYAFTAEFPAGYEADYLPAVITTIEHRCTQVSVAARSAASITAHIIDVDGDVLGPMSSVQLTLETAEDQQFVQSVWPDEKSNLHADNLLPGRYILGLNTYLPVSWSTPHYPPTYFPGVSRRSDAEVITLSAGEHKVLSEMRIKKGKECEIPVVVIDSLGKASPSAIVALAYPDYPHFYFQPREQTDENGKEIIYAVFPGPLSLRAEKSLEDGSTLQSESLEVSSCPTEPISLKLDRLAVDQPETKK
jgi:hypothetical protein